MPYATNSDNGAKIYYETEGSASTAILLHHGFGAALEVWRPAWSGPLSEDYLVVLMDSRGHGRSDKPHEARAYLMEPRVGDVTAVLDAIAVDQAHFLGYSMGGHVGFGMARYVPDRLRSLLIGGMHPYTRVPEPLDKRVASLARGIGNYLAKLEAMEGRRFPEPVRSWFLEHHVDALIASTQGTRDTRGLEIGLPNLGVPALIFAGDGDTEHHDLAEKSAGEIRNATFVSFVGLNHAQAGTQHQVVLPHITKFLKSVDGVGTP